MKNDYLPAAVLRSKGSFFSRVESHIDEDNSVIVTLAESQQVNNKADERQVIFDIDRIRKKNMPVENDALVTEIDDLHNHVWEIFESAQTGRLLDLLKGDKQ